MKVVITEHGLFRLSPLAVLHYEALSGGPAPEWWMFERNDPLLVKVVEALGSNAASGEASKLRVVEVPDGIEWEVDSNEMGSEWVAEKHRSWA